MSGRAPNLLCSLPLAWALTVSCNVSSAAKDKQSAGLAKGQGTCLAIVDGQTTGGFAATYAVVAPNRSASGSFFNCTGTFIGDNVMITASHCIPAAGPQDFIVTSNREIADAVPDQSAAGIKATAVFIDSRRQADASGMMDDQNMPRATDIALVLFPASTVSSWAVLASKPVDPGTPVTMVGYGRGDLDGTSVGNQRSKRIGRNTIAAPDDHFQTDGLYQVTGWAHEGEAAQHNAASSLGAQGDSGGPLLVRDTVVGIDVSGISDIKQPNLKSLIGSTGIDFYVDVTNATVKGLIATATAAGAHISTTDNLTPAQKGQLERSGGLGKDAGSSQDATAACAQGQVAR